MPATNKLIILFLAATPEDINRRKVDEETRAINRALHMAAFRDPFDPQPHGAVRAGDGNSHSRRGKLVCRDHVMTA